MRKQYIMRLEWCDQLGVMNDRPRLGLEPERATAPALPSSILR